jgi:hypothetical protein
LTHWSKGIQLGPWPGGAKGAAKNASKTAKFEPSKIPLLDQHQFSMIYRTASLRGTSTDNTHPDHPIDFPQVRRYFPANPGEGGGMSQVIQFYIPARFQRKTKWVAPHLRGKVIQFSREVRKSA